ncbi:YeeE/YedE family protein [Dyella sp. BiH032]|uniref:YeeE/YedE family protein n=1 Tax=Dyella sp. BiH032 TaxID=3075430 RepID=UPI002892D6E2|nr:YeeE/YedE family protein [Dyella sp. BiH032]WNL46117.1 YeeE/YedE family protein [Dyella sp. BiH032]
MSLRLPAAWLAGLLFGLGLVLSRMSDPRVVLGFLDVAGAFDPTLLFVLVGAVGVTAIAFRQVLRRSRPVLDERFHLPTSRTIDARLVLGAAIFGIGWGLAGYCPGPALVALGGGLREALYFVPAMLVGGIGYRWWIVRRSN